MKVCIILLSLICTIQLSVAANDAISGRITNVDWPDDIISASATFVPVPWVTVENTGAMTEFYARFSIQAPDGKWYSGACYATPVLKNNEESIVWPSTVQITSSMPHGVSYNAKVELFGDYCGRDRLDTKTKDYAFMIV